MKDICVYSNKAWRPIFDKKIWVNGMWTYIDPYSKLYVKDNSGSLTGYPVCSNPAARIPLTFTAEESSSTVKLTVHIDPSGGTTEPDLSGIKYRTNSTEDWKSYDTDTVIKLPKAGSYVQFMNAKSSFQGSGDFAHFAMTGKISASGSITSMANYSDLHTAGQYEYLFWNCTPLIKAPDLPDINLEHSCYLGLFDGCTSLIEVPDLQADTLAERCYMYMFNECTALKNAPQIHATTLADSCCSGMFYGCTSLTEAPELYATELVHRCYENMYYDCSKLRKVKVHFTSWSSDLATSSWIYNVNQSGTFIKPSALPNEYLNSDRIPEGWTVENF